MRGERAVTYAMPLARSSRLTPCMLSNRFAALILLCWPAGAQTPAPAAPAPVPATAPAPSGYVGSDTCQPCHEDIYNAFQKSSHKLVDTQKRRGWEGKACESCHGPGGAHAASAEKATIVNPAHLPAAEADRDCLKCHINQPTHIGRIQSSHAKNEVSCPACHSIHRNGPNGLVPRRMATINEQCASCHTAVWAEFQRPYKHRLPEGAMSCVDCHNPHGSILHASAQSYAANEPGCFRCHGNLRGPFTFEHAPVRLEGCGACGSGWWSRERDRCGFSLTSGYRRSYYIYASSNTYFKTRGRGQWKRLELSRSNRVLPRN